MKILTGYRYRSGLAAVLLTAAFSVSGEDYLGRDEFLGLACGDNKPDMHKLWVTD